MELSAFPPNMYGTSATHSSAFYRELPAVTPATNSHHITV